MATPKTPPKPSKKTSQWKRFIPIAVILLLIWIVYFSGLTKYLTFDALKVHRHSLLNFVETHRILTPILFILLYVVAIALSIPGAALLTILGGFLFPQPFSTLYVVIGATIGATCLFLAAKTALGNFLKRKAGPLLSKMEKGFQENAISYMFFLRLVPLVPFWLVNLAPAFFNIRIFTFVWTTFLGIIPGSFVYAQAGAGLGAILDTQGELNFNAIFNWQTRIALIALALFALIPIAIKKIRAKVREKKDVR